MRVKPKPPKASVRRKPSLRGFFASCFGNGDEVVPDYEPLHASIACQNSKVISAIDDRSVVSQVSSQHESGDRQINNTSPPSVIQVGNYRYILNKKYGQINKQKIFSSTHTVRKISSRISCHKSHPQHKKPAISTSHCESFVPIDRVEGQKNTDHFKIQTEYTREETASQIQNPGIKNDDEVNLIRGFHQIQNRKSKKGQPSKEKCVEKNCYCRTTVKFSGNSLPKQTSKLESQVRNENTHIQKNMNEGERISNLSSVACSPRNHVSSTISLKDMNNSSSVTYTQQQNTSNMSLRDMNNSSSVGVATSSQKHVSSHKCDSPKVVPLYDLFVNLSKMQQKKCQIRKRESKQECSKGTNSHCVNRHTSQTSKHGSPISSVPTPRSSNQRIPSSMHNISASMYGFCKQCDISCPLKRSCIFENGSVTESSGTTSQENGYNGSGLNNGAQNTVTPTGYVLKPSFGRSPSTSQNLAANMYRHDSQINSNVSAFHDSSIDINQSYSGFKDSSAFNTRLLSTCSSQSKSRPEVTQSFTSSNQFYHHEGLPPNFEKIYPKRNMNPEIRKLNMSNGKKIVAEAELDKALSETTNSKLVAPGSGRLTSDPANSRPQKVASEKYGASKLNTKGKKPQITYHNSIDNIGGPSKPLKVFSLRASKGSLFSPVPSSSAIVSESGSKTGAQDGSGYVSKGSLTGSYSPKLVSSDIVNDRSTKSSLLYSVLNKSFQSELKHGTTKNEGNLVANRKSSSKVYNLADTKSTMETKDDKVSTKDEIDHSGEPMVPIKLKSTMTDVKKVFSNMKERKKCGRDTESESEGGPEKIFKRRVAADKALFIKESSHQAPANKQFISKQSTGKQLTQPGRETSKMKNTSISVNKSKPTDKAVGAQSVNKTNLSKEKHTVFNKKEQRRRSPSPAHSVTSLESSYCGTLYSTGYDEVSSDYSSEESNGSKCSSIASVNRKNKHNREFGRKLNAQKSKNCCRSKITKSERRFQTLKSKFKKAILETLDEIHIEKHGEYPKSNDAKSDVKVSRQKLHSFKQNKSKDVQKSGDVVGNVNKDIEHKAKSENNVKPYELEDLGLLTDVATPFESEDEHSIEEDTVLPIETGDEDSIKDYNTMSMETHETEDELSMYEQDQFETDDENFMRSPSNIDDQHEDEYTNDVMGNSAVKSSKKKSSKQKHVTIADPVESEMYSDTNTEFDSTGTPEEDFDDDLDEYFEEDSEEYSEEVVYESNLSQTSGTDAAIGDLDCNTQLSSSETEESADTVKLAQSKTDKLQNLFPLRKVSTVRNINDLSTNIDLNELEPRERELLTSEEDDLLSCRKASNRKCQPNDIQSLIDNQDQYLNESASEASIQPINWNEKVHSEESIAELFSGDTFGPDEEGMIIKPEGLAVAFGVPPEIMSVDTLQPQNTEYLPENAEEVQNMLKKYSSKIPVPVKKDVEFERRPANIETVDAEPELRLNMLLMSMEEKDAPEVGNSEDIEDLFNINLEMELAYQEMLQAEQMNVGLPATDENSSSKPEYKNTTEQENSKKSKTEEKGQKSLKIDNSNDKKAGGACNGPTNRSPPHDKHLRSSTAPHRNSPYCNIHVRNSSPLCHVSNNSSPKRTITQSHFPTHSVSQPHRSSLSDNASQLRHSSISHNTCQLHHSSLSDNTSQLHHSSLPDNTSQLQLHHSSLSDNASQLRCSSPSDNASQLHRSSLTHNASQLHRSSLSDNASQLHRSSLPHNTGQLHRSSLPHNTGQLHHSSLPHNNNQAQQGSLQHDGFQHHSQPQLGRLSNNSSQLQHGSLKHHNIQSHYSSPTRASRQPRNTSPIRTIRKPHNSGLTRSVNQPRYSSQPHTTSPTRTISQPHHISPTRSTNKPRVSSPKRNAKPCSSSKVGATSGKDTPSSPRMVSTTSRIPQIRLNR